MARTVYFSVSDYYSMRTKANASLSAFLVFTGLVGSVPLYYLFSTLILRSPNWDWRIGALFGVAMIIAGVFLAICSRRTVRIIRENEETKIEVKDGFYRAPLLYTCKDHTTVCLKVTETQLPGNSFYKQVDCWETYLLEGKCQYLIDSRFDSVQESRGLAEFLAKNLNCRLTIQYGSAENAVDLDPKDLDLPYPARIKKYPALLGTKQDLPKNSNVEYKEFDNGASISFSWGMAASGIMMELFGVVFFAVLLGFLPLFGSAGKHFSLFSASKDNGDYTYFISIAAVFAVIFLIFYGLKFSTAVQRERINTSASIWGFHYYKSSILSQDIEEINARATINGARIYLISDAQVASLRISSMEVASAIATTIQHFLAEKS